MKKAGLCLVFLISVVGCRKPYNPPAVKASGTYLVVEGVIASAPDSIIIKVSNTVNLSNKTTINPVHGALLTIESDNNDIYPLTETTNGHYVSAGLNLDNTRKYHLRIKTLNDEYLSDFVPVVNSPAIDSVNFTVGINGINIYSNTHDPQNNTHYYRWDYQETWIIHSNYYSFYKSNGDTVLERDLGNDQVYQCWRSDTSNVILLASSVNLSKNVIVNNPITFVDPLTGKLGGRNSILVDQAALSNNAYSINVRQYGLTGDAYTFWRNLKKNTEQLGSIFDAQPSQINGNIHSIKNPAEIVIGYISAGSISSKRLFISNQQIPLNMAVTTNPVCTIDSFYFSSFPTAGGVPINQENEHFNYNTGAQYGGVKYVPVAAIFNTQLSIVIGHTGSTEACVDCTLKGTNKQPAFWR
ncbi:MAG TPA: DUF4249 domain-containing protein [Mucilaginibacter sp.]|jgi:hypothetical protein